ncbi:hypothetical protein BST91_03530 [Nonlabens tegetincola]|uniref:hypothetical protein n=1 Tax=Nonlabens tegetincola TaxID=323273 RepID=UPI000A2073EE|nr:hypothetical protein [Nonlabens tegetincola]ARN70784.1 hypothetical protein BST91_03530 [Nonlabens tegetincola]
MKLFLGIAFFLQVSILVAQNPQQVVSPGQQGYPTNNASQGGNYSSIDQKQVGSDVIVAQQGTANASFIEQTGTSVTNRNTVSVLQWGNVQPGTSGEQNYSDIKQNGAGNQYTLIQQGDMNENFGTQVGDNNKVLVQQGATIPQQAQNNLTLVNQNGSQNYAQVQQRFDNSRAQITQHNVGSAGIGNRSYTEQIANPNQSAGHTAIVSQYGDDNEAIQKQRGFIFFPNNNGNYAQIDQGDSTTAAQGNVAQQLQAGDDNEAYITQYGNDNAVFQEQWGKSNTAIASQNASSLTGGSNYIEQYQAGTHNLASATQNGSNNHAYQEQYLSHNTSIITQNGGQNGMNEAISLQRGLHNNSLIQQQASNNFASVDQVGNGHTSVIQQNQGSVTPNAGSNSAVVIQRNANVSLAGYSRRAAATRAHQF